MGKLEGGVDRYRKVVFQGSHKSHNAASSRFFASGRSAKATNLSIISKI